MYCTRAHALIRAREATKLVVTYKLGAGGRDPLAAVPMTLRDGTYGCDCSGFVAWALGYRRGPYNTDGILDDARQPGGWFERIAWSAARPGDLVVYGSRYVKMIRTAIGHVGILTRVGTRPGSSTVIHCSAGNDRRLGSAIRETSGKAWEARGEVVRYLGFVEEGGGG